MNTWRNRFFVSIFLAIVLLGTGTASADVSPSSPPPPVTNLIASEGAYVDKIRMDWDDDAGLTYRNYRIWRTTYPGGFRAQVGNGSQYWGGGFYEDFDADLNKTYSYSVVACTTAMECGAESALSNPGWVSQLAPPTGIDASEDKTWMVQVSWNPVATATHYKVYRRDGYTGDFYYRGMRDDPCCNFWNDMSALPGPTYFYKVKACNNAGCSELSGLTRGRREPSVPTGFQASDGTSTQWVELDWDLVEGDITHYWITSAPVLNGVYMFLDNPAGPPFYDHSVGPGATRYYKIKACGQGDYCGDEAGPDAGSVGWDVFSPSNVQASDGTYADKVRVTWNPVASVLYYEVYRAESADGAKSWIADPVMTTFDDLSAEKGTDYWYFLKSCMYTYCSENFSASDMGYRAIVPPAAPVNLQASDGTRTFWVEVIWSPGGPYTDVDYYKLWRSSEPNSGFSRVGGELPGPQFNDTNTFPGDDWFYKVQACNSAGCSDYSNVDVGSRMTVPAAPTNVQASDGTHAGVQITWTASANTVQYQIWRHSSDDFGQATQIGTAAPPDTSFFDDDPLGCEVSYYWVVASNGLGWGPPSDPDTGHAAGCGGGGGGLATPTPTTTATGTRVPTNTRTPTATATDTLTATSTNTPRPTQTATHTPTVTATRKTKDTATPRPTLPRRPTATPTRRPIQAPPPPQSVAASRGTLQGKVQLKWTSSDGATSYNVLRASSVSGRKVLLSRTRRLDYNDGSAYPGTVYCYWIQACQDENCGDYSAHARGYAAKPAAPTWMLNLPVILRAP
jgi:fibronectin type 3 domain-containing protein